MTIFFILVLYLPISFPWVIFRDVWKYILNIVFLSFDILGYGLVMEMGVMEEVGGG